MSGPICEWAVSALSVLYVLVVTLGMSGPICELAVSASSLHCMFLLSLSAWVDPSVSALYRPRVCIICSSCHSRHKWPICELAVLAMRLHCVHVVTLGMSEPICELTVLALRLHYVLVVTLSMSGPICELAVLALRLHYVHVVTLGMSGPICEWAVSASRLQCMLLLSLLAWVNPSESGLYLPWVCVICSCCHSRQEWTHLWVNYMCLECEFYLLVTLGTSEPICGWTVSSVSLYCFWTMLDLPIVQIYSLSVFQRLLHSP